MNMVSGQRGYPSRGGMHPQGLRSMGSPGGTAMPSMSPGASMSMAGSGMMRSGGGSGGYGTGRPTTPSDGGNFSVVPPGAGQQGGGGNSLMYQSQMAGGVGVAQYRRALSQPGPVMTGNINY